jgi:hypothetical protein
MDKYGEWRIEDFEDEQRRLHEQDEHAEDDYYKIERGDAVLKSECVNSKPTAIHRRQNTYNRVQTLGTSYDLKFASS